jgi:hypothetical protein
MDDNKIDRLLEKIERGEEEAAKGELFKEVGRAIVMLSNIEELLAVVFMIVSNKISQSEAANLFYGFNTFEQRFRLVGYAVAHNDWGGELEAWNRFSHRLSEKKSVRNLLAHQGLLMKKPTDGGSLSLSLTPPRYMSGRKGRMLELKEIKRAADDLEELHKELWSFIRSLTPNKEE